MNFSKLMIGALVALMPMSAMAADFVGPRVEAQVGYNNSYNGRGVSYGVEAGYDLALTKNVIVGPFVGVASSSGVRNGQTAGRDLFAGAQVGYKLSPTVLVDANVAYANSRVNTNLVDYNLEGVRVGGGLQYALTNSVYASGGYDHTFYRNNVCADAVKLGVGFRF